VIKEADRHDDLVVIDSPPTFGVPDAVPLIKRVGGVISITRVEFGSRDAARQLRDEAANHGAPILGIVVNGVEQWRERYNHAYSAATGNSTAASAVLGGHRTHVRNADTA
jgi:Mrp family chromosome partitioning ATPase